MSKKKPLKVVKITEMCRVCFTQSIGIMSKLTECMKLNEEKEIFILEALEKVVSAKISLNEQFPQCICPMCMSILKMSYQFVTQFESTQDKLQRETGIISTYKSALNRFHSNQDSSVISLQAQPAPIEITGNDLNEFKVLVVEETENEVVEHDLLAFNSTSGSANCDLISDSLVEKVQNGSRILSNSESMPFDTMPCSNQEVISETKDHPFSCKICGRYFPHATSLRSHSRQHTGKTPFTCFICNKSYRCSRTLKQHNENKHYVLDDMEQENEIRAIKKDSGQRTCGICKDKFSKDEIVSHRKMHSPKRKQFVCPYCKKIFYKYTHIERHIRIHTGERPYRCELCTRKFVQKEGLKKHMETHTREKNYQCEHCGKRFSFKVTLTSHMVVHTGIRRKNSFICKICNKCYTSYMSLKQHTMSHTGERAFVCSYCGLGYSNRVSFSRHVMRDHTGEKPHKCIICCRGFHHTDDLNRHVKRMHTILENNKDGEAIE